MSITAEAIELIQNTAVGADREPIVEVPGDAEHVFYMREGDKLVKSTKERTLLYRELFTLPDVVEAVSRDKTGNTVVFCGRGKIRVVLDDEEWPREWVGMNMPVSPEFATLKNLQGQRSSFAQRKFISLLRIDLAGCDTGDLVKLIRNLKFSKSEGGESKIENSRETVGRSVKMELTAGEASAIPDELTLPIHVYNDLVLDDTRNTVKCAIDTNLDEATFTLIPMSGELERAQRETDEWIKADLQRNLKDVAVLCGAASS